MNLPQTKRREQQNNSPFSRTIDKYNVEVLLHYVIISVHLHSFMKLMWLRVLRGKSLSFINWYWLDDSHPTLPQFTCCCCSALSAHILQRLMCCSHADRIQCAFLGYKLQVDIFFLFSYSKYSDQKNCPCASRNCDIRWNIFVLCTDKHDFP